MNYITWLLKKCKNTLSKIILSDTLVFFLILASLVLFLLFNGICIVALGEIIFKVTILYSWMYYVIHPTICIDLILFFIYTYSCYKKEKQEKKEEIVDKILGSNKRCPKCNSDKIVCTSYPVSNKTLWCTCTSCGNYFHLR